MATVMRHLLQPSVTEGYPWEPKVLPERSRTSFALPLDENGVPCCKSCMLCAQSCPDDAITIESEKREDGPGRVLTKFTIDLGLCMYCGMCVESCPSIGLHHTGDFENATTERERHDARALRGRDVEPPVRRSPRGAPVADTPRPRRGGEVA